MEGKYDNCAYHENQPNSALYSVGKELDSSPNGHFLYNADKGIAPNSYYVGGCGVFKDNIDGGDCIYIGQTATDALKCGYGKFAKLGSCTAPPWTNAFW